MKIPKIGKEGKSEIIELPPLEPLPPETSPDEIDARRAKHSLERAVQLAEKGDINGAILAARQAIALDHDFGDAHSVLGGLLERMGDLKGAIASHKRAVQLMPESALERTTLERLQEKIGGGAGNGFFNFDDEALFDPKADLPPVIEARLPPTRVDFEAKLPPTRADLEAKNQTTAPVIAPVPAPETTPFDASLAENAASAPPSEVSPPRPIPEIKISLPSVPDHTPPSVAPPTAVQRRNAPDRRQNAVPITVERRSGHDRRADAAALAARAQAAATPFVFNPLTDTPKPPLYAQILRGPSFFARTLPLVGVTILSLGFLSWAKSRAIQQNAGVATASTTPVLVPSDPVPASPSNSAVPTAVPVQGVPAPGPELTSPQNPGEGFSISNRPPSNPNTTSAAPRVATAAQAPRAGQSTGQGTSARPAPRSQAGTNERPVPRFPAGQIPPAAIPPVSSGEENGNTRGPLVLPQPQIEAPAPADPPVRVLPPDTPSVPGGSGLNPAGNPARGYVRIQSGRNVLTPPTRSQNQGNNAESAAAAAARGGNSDRAIENLTAAINAGGNDAGFRLQQRANLFLERGDYGRAAEDFQAAINAYQDQIARGENTSSANAGLRSARAGLNRALARRN